MNENNQRPHGQLSNTELNNELAIACKRMRNGVRLGNDSYAVAARLVAELEYELKQRS